MLDADELSEVTFAELRLGVEQAPNAERRGDCGRRTNPQSWDVALYDKIGAGGVSRGLTAAHLVSRLTKIGERRGTKLWIFSKPAAPLPCSSPQGPNVWRQ